MALINLNALGSAIRTKVGETEKKTLPQLKSIVDNQLVYPQDELSVTTNGNYDVKSYALVNVATDERTAQDYKNAIDIASWNAGFEAETSTLNVGSLKKYTGEIPYISAINSTSLERTFLGSKFAKLTLDIGNKITNFNSAFDTSSNLTSLKIVGSTAGVTNFSSAFSECRKLETIDGELDFSSATNIAQTFNLCLALNSINIKPNTINANNTFGLPSDRPNSVYLAIINGLNTVGTYHTTTWSETLKRKFGAMDGYEATLWCREVDGLFVDCAKTDDGAISYASAITSKGWTIV